MLQNMLAEKERPNRGEKALESHRKSALGTPGYSGELLTNWHSARGKIRRALCLCSLSPKWLSVWTLCSEQCIIFLLYRLVWSCFG